MTKIDDEIQPPSVAELRKSIPARCFERSLLRNVCYVLRDSLLAICIGYLAHQNIPIELSIASALGWTVYCFIQGTIVMGLWVIGHECGHGAFSNSSIINDMVGFTIHSFLLVPYFSWQRTHAVHHARCNHLLDGETHNPGLKKKMIVAMTKAANLIGEDAFVILQIIGHLFFGWLLYLFYHETGSRRSPITKERYKQRPNHFDPRGNNELFPVKMLYKVALSTGAVLGVIALLSFLMVRHGVISVLLHYVGPYLVVNGWLVLYTWLHHTSVQIPHYGDEEWTWLKGALSTVDRPYPWIIDELHHHIGSTHVCHHIFHELPHYHAQEATRALKTKLGELYRYDSTPILSALWSAARDCHFVDGLEGKQYYKSIFSVDNYNSTNST